MQTPPSTPPARERIFPAPTLRQEIGTGRMLLLTLPLLAYFLVILWAVGFAAPGYRLGALAISGIGLLALALLVTLIALGRAKVILTADRLVEVNYWNGRREFRYEQIIEVRRGSRAGALCLRYHPLDRSGAVDHARVRAARLISVQNAAALELLLSERVTAPPSGPARPSPAQGRLLVLLTLGALLAIAAALAALLLLGSA